LTIVLFLTATTLFSQISPAIVVIYILGMIFLTFVCPFWLIWIQRYKKYCFTDNNFWTLALEVMTMIFFTLTMMSSCVPLARFMDLGMKPDQRSNMADLWTTIDSPLPHRFSIPNTNKHNIAFFSPSLSLLSFRHKVV